jgi:hypothetical protein
MTAQRTQPPPLRSMRAVITSRRPRRCIPADPCAWHLPRRRHQYRCCAPAPAPRRPPLRLALTAQAAPAPLPPCAWHHAALTRCDMGSLVLRQRRPPIQTCTSALYASPSWGEAWRCKGRAAKAGPVSAAGAALRRGWIGSRGPLLAPCCQKRVQRPARPHKRAVGRGAGAASARRAVPAPSRSCPAAPASSCSCLSHPTTSPSLDLGQQQQRVAVQGLCAAAGAAAQPPPQRARRRRLGPARRAGGASCRNLRTCCCSRQRGTCCALLSLAHAPACPALRLAAPAPPVPIKTESSSTCS